MDGNITFGRDGGQLTIESIGQLYADTLYINEAFVLNEGILGMKAIINDDGNLKNYGFIEVTYLQNESQGIIESSGKLRVLQYFLNSGEMLQMELLEMEGFLENEGVLYLQEQAKIYIYDTLINTNNGDINICGTIVLKLNDLANLADEIRVPAFINHGELIGCEGNIQSEIDGMVINEGDITGNVSICLKAGDYINNGNGDFIVDCCLLFTVEAGRTRKTCLGENVELGGSPTVQNGAEPYTVQWESSTGTVNIDVENPVVTPTTSTFYTVTVSDANNCTATDSVIIDPVTHLLVKTGSASEDICLGDSIMLGSQNTVRCGSTPYTINWTPNQNISDPTSPNPIVWPTETTTYTITASDADTTISKNIIVNVEELPTRSVVGDNQVACSSDRIELSANEPLAGIGRWIKIRGSGEIGNHFDPYATLINPTVEDTIGMVWAIQNGTCVSTDTTWIVNLRGPVESDAGIDQTLCNHTTTEIEGNQPDNGSSGLWSLVSGSAEITDPQSPLTSVTGLTVGEEVILRWTITKEICQGSTFDEVLITVDDAPTDPGVMLAFRDTTIKVGESIQLLVEGGVSYQWEPVDFLDNSQIPNPIASPTEDITYTVFVNTDSGCLIQDQVVIRIDNELSYYVPEMFTPNGDGANDMLFVNMLGYRSIDFKVFNRFGQLVFSTNDANVGWDGRFNGNIQNPDTYVYTLVLETYKEEMISEKGSFQLVR